MQGGSSISPVITRSFAREILAGGASRPENQLLACFCLSQPGAVPIELLSACLSRRRDWEKLLMDNLGRYHAMCFIIGEAGVRKVEEKKKERRMIPVD